MSRRKLSQTRRLGGSRPGTVLIYTILILVSLMMILPFVHELAKSFSHPNRVNAGQVIFLPRELTLGNYSYYFQDQYRQLWKSFAVTIYITVFGTLWSVFFTAVMAFPMSRPKKEFRAKPLMIGLVIFSIIFFPPLIPYFLVVKSYGLVNTLWSIILTHTIMPFNLILVMTYYQGIPEELLESCRLDGGNDLLIAWRIVMPLAKPVLATIAVYTGVLLWNVYLHPLLFITDSDIMPLQPVVRSIMNRGGDSMPNELTQSVFDNSESVKSSLVLLTILPVVVAYPFLQKFFAKGALLGSLKS